MTTLFVYVYAISSGARGLNYALHLYAYFVYSSSDDSDESLRLPEPSLLENAISTKHLCIDV